MFNNIGFKDAFKFHDGCLKLDPKPSDDKRRLSYSLLPLVAQNVNDRSGRGAELGCPAGFKLDQPFGRPVWT